MAAPPLIIACGALARDLQSVLASSEFAAVEVRYLPANLHNAPSEITVQLRPLLDEFAASRDVFVAYADCGTGGLLDALLREYPGVTRLAGAHCYEMFAGAERFAALHDAELGTFYLTDFLALHFDALVWGSLGLRDHPSLRDTYFGNYRKVVHLAQCDDAAITVAARRAAALLELPLTTVAVGRVELARAIEARYVAS